MRLNFVQLLRLISSWGDSILPRTILAELSNSSMSREKTQWDQREPPNSMEKPLCIDLKTSFKKDWTTLRKITMEILVIPWTIKRDPDPCPSIVSLNLQCPSLSILIARTTNKTSTRNFQSFLTMMWGTSNWSKHKIHCKNTNSECMEDKTNSFWLLLSPRESLKWMF